MTEVVHFLDGLLRLRETHPEEIGNATLDLLTKWVNPVEAQTAGREGEGQQTIRRLN